MKGKSMNHIIHDRPRQAVILAGGRGTRLRPLTNDIPKPMIRFNGKPFLEYLIRQLQEQGFKKVLLLLGYLPQSIKEYFRDGRSFGIAIEYSVTDVENETGTRLRLAKPFLDSCFLLLYCDNYWPMNFDRMWNLFISMEAEAQISVYTNKDGYTRSNLRVNSDSMVEVYDKTRTAENLKGVDIGYAIIKRDILRIIPEENTNFERIVYSEMVKQNRLSAYETDHRYYSVSDFKRLHITDLFLKRSPAIILDRDGVINTKPPKACYVTRQEEFAWIPGAKEAIRLLKEKGYKIIVITNQAGIARGKMTVEDLDTIHTTMRSELICDGEYRQYVDAIYFCPHGWDDGCECRKPKPGMLFSAQKEFHLDLSHVCFIGDDIRDKQAGEAAGCMTYLVSDKKPLLELVKEKFV